MKLILSNIFKKIFKFLKQEILITIFLFILIIISFLNSDLISHYYKYINCRAIITLIGLLLSVTGIQKSEYIEIITKKFIKKINNERLMAVVLITLSIILSMILTNDVALFIVIPFTIVFQKQIKNDLTKLIVFETLSVNTGSLLTPIGNPQNIYIWSKWDVPFFEFILKMFPAFLISISILYLLIIILFPLKKLEFKNIIIEKKIKNKKLFIFSIISLILFITTLELNYEVFGLIMIIFLMFFVQKEVIVQMDWGLILLFILIFIDFTLISNFVFIKTFLYKIYTNTSTNLYFISLFLSQIISNVPATVFLSKFTDNWVVLLYGTNIGGNGFVIASFANLIMFRLFRSKNLFINFHKYSIIYFLLSSIAMYLILIRFKNFICFEIKFFFFF